MTTNSSPTAVETGELEPCPFCGNSESPTVFGLKPDQWWVECSGYEGLCCKLFLSTTKEEAIRRWNTRANPHAELERERDALASALRELMNRGVEFDDERLNYISVQVQPRGDYGRTAST